MINSLRRRNEQPFDAGRAKAIRKSDARAQGDKSTVLMATIRAMLTNRLTGTIEATATTATNTQILRPGGPVISQTHPNAQSAGHPDPPTQGRPIADQDLQQPGWPVGAQTNECIP
jgi:hypothetical protein